MEIFSHDPQQRQLAQGLFAGSLPHALLLTGPRGVGKALVARKLVSAALHFSHPKFVAAKPAAPTLDVPADSPVLRRYKAGSHADAIFIERLRDEKTQKLKSAITVDQIRALHRIAHRTAAEGGMRAVIIDNAHEMNTAAQNALLKVLEEPPRDCLLILISHAPSLLLPTIHSRVQAMAFAPLKDEIVEQIMAEKTTVQGEQRQLAVTLAEGSIGRALELAEAESLSVIWQSLKSLAQGDDAPLRSLPKLVSRKGGEEAFDLIASLWPQALLAAAKAQIRGAAPLLPVSCPPQQMIELAQNLQTLLHDAQRRHLSKSAVMMQACFLLLQKDVR